jgi:hypothetical protein
MKRLLSVKVAWTTDCADLGFRRVFTTPLVMLVLGAVSACSFAPSWPPMSLPESMTRAQIDHFRAREQDRLQNALRECYQRFAVNDCRREAMNLHNEVQRQLRSEELRLNALDREERQRKLQNSPEVPRAGADGAATGTGTPP